MCCERARGQWLFSWAGVGSAELACNRRRGSGVSYDCSSSWLGCYIGLKVWISWVARVIVVTLPYLALGRHGVRSGVELVLVTRGGLLCQQRPE